MLTLTHLLEDAKCDETVRRLRWPEGIIECPHCQSPTVMGYSNEPILLANR